MQKIIVKDVSKIYGENSNKVIANDAISFDINEGEFVAIIGPSGSGKTTFLTILGNLQEATSGEITFCGEDITNLNEKRKTELRFEEFGFILQASNLIPFLKVGEQLDLIDKLGISEKEKMNRKELFDMLGLEKLKHSYPKELSGGERQRAAIARALYNNPRVILADEPTASLDTNRAHQVADLLAEIAHKQNKGVVMITHDTRLLDKVDRVYRMEDGHLIEIKK